MFLSKIVRAFYLIWILAGGLLVACRPASEAPLLTPTVEPLPTPASTPSPAASAVPVEGLVLNEDPPRTSLFNINTLAYELPGMDEVEVLNYTYAYLEDQPLTVDLYYPPDTAAEDRLPAVIFGLGFRMSEVRLRNAHFYTSWGKLVAAAGMIGVAYDTEQPDRDLEILMAFLRDNAETLRIDTTRLGFHSTSNNPPTVMSYLMQEGRNGIQFSVYYYGLSLTPDRKYTEELAQVCAKGCLVADLADVTYVDPDVALLVVKVGRDHVVASNEAMDHFIEYVREAGATVTVIEYEDGRHGFDTQQKTEEAAQIISETVAFMREHFGLE